MINSSRKTIDLHFLHLIWKQAHIVYTLAIQHGYQKWWSWNRSTLKIQSNCVMLDAKFVSVYPFRILGMHQFESWKNWWFVLEQKTLQSLSRKLWCSMKNIEEPSILIYYPLLSYPFNHRIYQLLFQWCRCLWLESNAPTPNSSLHAHCSTLMPGTPWKPIGRSFTSPNGSLSNIYSYLHDHIEKPQHEVMLVNWKGV